MKERVARSLFWMVWSRGGIQALSFLSTLFVARWVSPGDYGVMAVVGIWTAVFAMLAELGLGGAVVQFKDVDEGELNVIFWLTLVTTVSGYLLLFSAAPGIAEWFGIPRVTDALRVASLSLLLASIRLIPDAMLRKEVALDKIAQAEMAAAVLSIPVTLGLAWNGAGVWALVLGWLTQACTQTALIVRFRPWFPGFVISGRRLGAMLRYSLSAVGAHLGWALYQQVDSVIVGKVTNEQSLGLYSMAKHLATLPVTKISVVVNQLSFPILSRWQDDRERLQDSFVKILRLVTCVTMPLSIGGALVADDFVRVALGPNWMPVVPMFRIFCLYAVLHSVQVLFGPVLLARYRTGFLFRRNLLLLVVMPGPFVVGAWWYGTIGVALAWVLVYPLVLVGMAREGMRELGLKASALLRELSPLVRPLLLMTLAVVAVRLFFPVATVGATAVRLTVEILLGAASYGGGIMVDRRMCAEVVEIFGWVFRPRHALGVPKAATQVGGT
ncbi:lipopolysaccharide biosynthesis protein [Candidatus Nitrospira bockiana]